MFTRINRAEAAFKAVQGIADTASKTEKLQLIKTAGLDSALFMRAMKACYDPFITYGIANAPKKREGLAPGTNTMEEEQFWSTLDRLASRKLSGNDARIAVQGCIDLLDESSSELFRRILNKDMRAGFTDGTLNKAFPGTIPEFPYMRCSLPDKSNMAKWDWSLGVISQEKADGMYANVDRRPGEVTITSRQGNTFPVASMGLLGEELMRFLEGDTQTHGEMLVEELSFATDALGEAPAWRVLPREIGNGILNSIQQEGSTLPESQRIRFMAWDQIPLSAVVPKGKYEIGYRHRLANLIRQLRPGADQLVGLVPTRLVKSKFEAYAHYRELLKKGKEGTVCKQRDAIWRDGTSKDQVKLKLAVEIELKIVGFYPGTPGTKREATFGSLMCVSECGKLEVCVGTGLTDARLEMINNDRPRFLGSIITARANGIMSPSHDDAMHSLFLPVLIELRNDKSEANSLEEIQSIFAAAAEAA